MRTQTEILNEIKSAYIADATVRERYNITGNDTFDQTFATVSIESIIFYVVSVAIYGIEFLLGKHISEVESRDVQMRIGTIEWWIKLCKEFQYGHDLTYNEETYLYGYAEEDTSAQIIKYATVREGPSGLNLLINTQVDGLPVSLELLSSERDAFDAYLSKVKIAGLPLIWGSYNADQVQIELTVVRDVMLLNVDGVLIDNGTMPVNLAVSNYIASLAYGSGTINKTALISAIVDAVGVIDAYFTADDWLRVSTDVVPTFTPVVDQNLLSFGGSFILREINLIITYV